MSAHPFAPPVTTVVDLLRWRAEHQPAGVGYTFLADGEDDARDLTWGALDQRARAVAHWLQQRIQPGARVLLMFEEGHDYLYAFYGCMYAGALAVAVHPPDPRKLHRTLPRLLSICGDAGVTVVLTTAHIARGAKPALADDPTLGQAHWLSMEDLDDRGADGWRPPQIGPDDLAYLQYTSGSTSTPKGVMISHHNLIHQLHDFDTGYDHTPDSVMVTWLPATHDLGLVYGRLMALFVGFRCVYMSPVSFMQRPLRWMVALDKYRGTHSPSPNFGFEIVARKTTSEERRALDLSCVKMLLNGAEPIRQESEQLFIDTFAEARLPASAVTHAMGMSESTAKIITEPIDRAPPRFVHLDPEAYEDNRVVLVTKDFPNVRTVASCGHTVMDTRVFAVDPHTHQKLGQDRVGEMWVGGTTVAQGYYNNPKATEATFNAHTTDGDGPFLRTGDLAFVHDDEVYLTGRLKDVIIIRGQNHHPQDVEWSLQEAVSACRPNCAAAFGFQVNGEERLGLVTEVYPDRVGDADALFGKVRQAVAEDHGLHLEAIVFIPPRALPKTSSGKIQRTKARQRFLDSDFEVIAQWRASHNTAQVHAHDEDLRARLNAASGRRKQAILMTYIQTLTAELMDLDLDDVEVDQPLSELGLDSVTAVEMVERVGTALGQTLSGTALFDYPTIEKLATWLLEEGAQKPAPTASPTATASTPMDTSDVAAMSEEEAAAALLAELEDL